MLKTLKPRTKQLLSAVLVATIALLISHFLIARFGLEYISGNHTHTGIRGGYHLFGIKFPYWCEPIARPVLFAIFLGLSLIVLRPKLSSRAA